MPLYLSGNFGWIATVTGLFFVCMILFLDNRRKQKSAKSALSDTVTGGLTEPVFHTLGKRILAGGASSFAFVSMEIENLPQIYKSFGSAECERTLQYLHSVLQSQLSREEIEARTGEDSFCFMLKNRKPDEICARLDRIYDAVNRHNQSGSEPYLLQMRFGVYLPDNREEDIKAIQGKAVLARLSGSSERRYHFYDRKLQENAGREREVAQSIDHALQTSEFVVYYQPKIRVLDQRIAGAEAFIRWRHPQRGLLSPDMFLPLAEQYQKAYRIDQFVFHEACRTINRWMKQGKEICPISINLSRAALEQSGFADECFEVCNKFAVDPAQFEFEIKESLLLENPERSRSMLERLHALGFRCAVDNFGSNLASLQMFGRLDIDTIKLDNSFFTGENDNRRGRYIIESILKLATQLHIQTVATGVEKRGQTQYLQQVACDMMQGFYYFKPMPLERFESEVYDNDTLKYAENSTDGSNEQADKKHSAIGAKVQTTSSIILFSYLPEEDTVEFSEAFSPVLGNQKKVDNALALFRTTDLIHQNDKEDFFRLLERSQREDGWVENTLRFYMAQGRYGWLELRMRQERMNHGSVINGAMLNISEWKNEVDRWKEKATRDTLTGLYNREFFENNTRTQLEKSSYTSAAMMFIDVDDFKRVNDTLGHMFGDDVLCYVAKQILGVFRHTDIIARYGGDEFVVFAPSIHREVLEDRLKKLCGAFRFPYRNDVMEYKVSVTVGAAMYPQDGTDYETLLDHADCALYEAKSRGKDQFVLYEPHMQGEPASK